MWTIFQAEFKSLAATIMGACFSITTPFGIVIGIIVTNTYKEDSSTALIVEGVLNSASAGILIYMALVDLLSPDFMNPRMQKNKMLQLGSNVSLLLGAGLMSLLAKWAWFYFLIHTIVWSMCCGVVFFWWVRMVYIYILIWIP